MKRENFGSRLGFLLVSAGCAIGIGNVWRFPYVAGQNGGGVFVLFYLLFLLCMGVPVLTMELAVGRAGRKSAVGAYRVLEKPGSKWHVNDVLHDRIRLDAQLFREVRDGNIHRNECGSGRGSIWGYAQQSRRDGILDGCDRCCRILYLQQRSSEWP